MLLLPLIYLSTIPLCVYLWHRWQLRCRGVVLIGFAGLAVTWLHPPLPLPLPLPLPFPLPLPRHRPRHRHRHRHHRLLLPPLCLPLERLRWQVTLIGSLEVVIRVVISYYRYYGGV